MDELKMTGNCLKGSRPLLSFDQSFDLEPQYQLLKEMFIHTFGTPKGHRKSKPFFDHVLSFSITDGRIWFRNYQIVEKKNEATGQQETSLVEIGPRFIMQLIRVFEGSFGGPVLFENEEFVSPNAVRSLRQQESADKYRHRSQAQQERQEKLADAHPPRTELDEVDEVFRA
jgi:ribosome biogenesis protein BRX1